MTTYESENGHIHNYVSAVHQIAPQQIVFTWCPVCACMVNSLCDHENCAICKDRKEWVRLSQKGYADTFREG